MIEVLKKGCFLDVVVCAERFRRCPVEAVLVGSTPVHHPLGIALDCAMISYGR